MLNIKGTLHQILHMKIGLLIMRNMTQPVKTVVNVFYISVRNSVKSEKEKLCVTHWGCLGLKMWTFTSQGGSNERRYQVASWEL